MNIAIVGSGYVGLTAGVCFAESGNHVISVDSDAGKIAQLQSGRIPIYEPGLEELLVSNARAGRLKFSTDLSEAVRKSQVIFIAVSTPVGENGQADISQVRKVALDIAGIIDGYRIIVIKSTVPVGATRDLKELMVQKTTHKFDLLNNPEFLKEGHALDDFSRPDRVIIGSDSVEAAAVVEELYRPFVRSGKPVIIMDTLSSEMTKYAANAMLSTKISFINEVANLCQLLGADVDNVRRGICSDSRIGYQFLYPGLGFGGSCFPKDLAGLICQAKGVNYPAWLLEAVRQVNQYQHHSLQRMINQHFGKSQRGGVFAIWGLSFKPRTDDIRQSAALGLIEDLLVRRGTVRVHDPQAMENVRSIFGDKISYHDNCYEVLRGADALCIVTEWNEFRNPDFQRIKSLMHEPVIFDGRNLYKVSQMADLGFVYYSIGRAACTSDTCTLR